MKHILFAIVLLLAANVSVGANKPVRVSGHGVYHDDGHLSRIECEKIALENARTEALGREFGWEVEGVVYEHDIHATDGTESTYFDSRHARHVKGEWIADEEVTYTHSLSAEGNYIVQCTVKGTARGLHNESIDFEAIVLRAGTDRKNQSTKFSSGENMYLMLRTPVDGYLAVYLVDPTHQAYNILPYNESPEQSVHVKRDKEYIFFSDAHAKESEYAVDKIRLTTEELVERNEIIVIFSPNKFNKPLDTFVSDYVPRTLTEQNLANWITKAQRSDSKMSIKRIPVTIESI